MFGEIQMNRLIGLAIDGANGSADARAEFKMRVEKTTQPQLNKLLKHANKSRPESTLAILECLKDLYDDITPEDIDDILGLN